MSDFHIPTAEAVIDRLSEKTDTLTAANIVRTMVMQEEARIRRIDITADERATWLDGLPIDALHLQHPGFYRDARGWCCFGALALLFVALIFGVPS